MGNNKVSVSQKVIDYLKTNIENANWAVGDTIPSENTLTKLLGVSRASVRLAIRQFIAVGVMKSHHGKGTFIVSDDMSVISGTNKAVPEQQCRDVEKVLEFRSIVEPATTYLAAQKADAAVVATLKRHLGNLVESIGDSENFVKQDMLFHIEISRASDNPLLEQSMRVLFDQTVQDHTQINTIFGYKDGVYYHSLILKAFERRDPKLARKLMAEHLNQALEQLRNSQAV